MKRIRRTPLSEVVEITSQWQRAGLRIGFTNGCFDLLHPGQSQTAQKTLELVQRSHFIAKSQPKFLRDVIGPVVFGKGDHRSGELFVTKQESEILGLAQGPDQIRQFHPSRIFLDEAAFQIEAEAAYAAIKPAILMGGAFSMISSANRSWFEKICRDTSDN